MKKYINKSKHKLTPAPSLRKERGLIREGEVRSEELWITSKVWNHAHGEGKVLSVREKSLKDLRLDYLDLYLLHWPLPNYHAPGCDGNARNPDSRPYIHEELVAWRQMEQLMDRRMVRTIGTSNMTRPKMELLFRVARIKPVINEMELHPHFQQQALIDYLVEKGIQPIGHPRLGGFVEY